MENAKHIEIIHGLKGRYRTGKDDLGLDFFRPCLTYCTRYRRATGYFTSNALIIWSSALPRIIQSEHTIIDLLISPNLKKEDSEALRQAIDPDERHRILSQYTETLIEMAIDYMRAPSEDKLKLELFMWLVANKQLIIKFGFPEHIDNAGVFHEKTGIFDFPWGDRVAFIGSANETSGGHTRNYESVHVYRSWLAEDQERIRETIEEFEAAWAGIAPGLKVLGLSEKSLAYVKEVAPSARPTNIEDRTDRKRWRHQDEAVDIFMTKGRGILNMATGTGKTKTAMKILTKAFDKHDVDCAIITTKGTDLLDQWDKEINEWNLSRPEPKIVLHHYEQHHDLSKFTLAPSETILIISRQELHKVINEMPPEMKSKCIIVHDEVHGLGESTSQQRLKGAHLPFRYVLGLSATPVREYDEEGTDFISEEIGPEIFSFSIKDAIERGILCEFDYTPLSYELTESDKKRIRAAYSAYHARKKAGQSVLPKDLWRELANVYKTAEMKPSIFKDFVHANPKVLEHSIVFVATKEYGAQFLDSIHSISHKYSTYFDDDDRSILIRFSAGQIDCLVTCHRISQGIDIRHLQNIILVSSDRGKLETIQRIGRCLRTDPDNPNKISKIVDFIRLGPDDRVDESSTRNPDRIRMEWLSELSKTRRIE